MSDSSPEADHDGAHASDKELLEGGTVGRPESGDHRLGANEDMVVNRVANDLAWCQRVRFRDVSETFNLFVGKADREGASRTRAWLKSM
jgi:hypothetical protein